MIQHTQLGLGPLAVPLARGLVNAIAGLCGEEAGRLLGLKSSHAARAREDSPAAASQPNASVQGAASTSPAPSNSDTGPDVEELPSTSRALWRGGAGKVPAATNPQEQEEPREELGQQAAAGPSAQGCRCSSSTPRLRGPSNPGSTAGQAVPRTASCPARGCLSSTSSRAPGDLKSKNNKIYDCSTEKACATQKRDSNKSGCTAPAALPPPAVLPQSRYGAQRPPHGAASGRQGPCAKGAGPCAEWGPEALGACVPVRRAGRRALRMRAGAAAAPSAAPRSLHRAAAALRACRAVLPAPGSLCATLSTSPIHR